MYEEFFDELKDKNILLNDQQKQAVAHMDGPCLVLAVPGGGKTTVLLSRIGFLTKICKIPSDNILCITFSNASADDMQLRVKERFSEFNIESDFMTIHSLANKIVRDYDKIYRIRRTLIEGDNPSPYTKRKLIKDFYLKYNLEDVNDERIDEVILAIGNIHNGMITNFSLLQSDIPNLEKIFRDYEELKKNEDLIDYDGMLTEAYKILQSEPLILNKYRSKYQYIQVDEAQDNSMIQHELIKLIGSPGNNICYVSDDDQSIYSFRSAVPEYLLNIDKIFPSTTKYFMEQNYRSTPEIVDAARGLIQNNKKRYKKNVFTQKQKGDKVNIISVKDTDKQLDHLVKSIEKAKRFNEVAVLYRTNISSIAIANKLMLHGIPFRVQGYNDYFFRHWIIEDIKAFLRLANNPDNLDNLEKIFKKFNSKLTGVMIQWAKMNGTSKDMFDSILENPNLDIDEIESIKKVKWKFHTLSKKSPEHAIDYIEDTFSYKSHIEYICEKSGYSLEGMKRIITSVKLIAKANKDILGFLYSLEMLEQEMSQSAAEEEGVILSTIHSSKGLEWDEVFMVDLMNGSFPSYQTLEKSKNGDEFYMEEERRLFYVAMTRAKKRLNLYKIFEMNNLPVEPSIFLNELDEILFPDKISNLFAGINSAAPIKPSGIKPVAPSKRVTNVFKGIDTKGYDVGSEIEHKQYGFGLIKENNGDTIKVDFSGILKTLSLKVCIEGDLIKKIK